MKLKFLLLLPLLLILVDCDGANKVYKPSAANVKFKNVVYFIGDGMGYEAIKAGEYSFKQTYNFTKWHNYSLNTNSVTPLFEFEYVVTDSAAAGTALATGKKTINGYIGKDGHAKDLETVLDVAKKKNKDIGIITTDNLYGATPASFSAHSISRKNSQEILNSQATTSNLDLLIGKYSSLYHNNASTFVNEGFTYSETLDETIKTNDRLIINTNNIYPYDDNHSFTNSIKYAFDYLSRNENGFVLMVEQAHIDKYAHEHNFEGISKSMNELNNAIEYVSNYFKNRDDTLIIVTADHETGGLQVKGDPNSFTYSFSTKGHTYTHVPYYSNLEMFSNIREKSLINNSSVGLILKEVI